jgi:hypothetical protein
MGDFCGCSLGAAYFLIIQGCFKKRYAYPQEKKDESQG